MPAENRKPTEHELEQLGKILARARSVKMSSATLAKVREKTMPPLQRMLLEQLAPIEVVVAPAMPAGSLWFDCGDSGALLTEKGGFYFGPYRRLDDLAAEEHIEEGDRERLFDQLLRSLSGPRRWPWLLTDV